MLILWFPHPSFSQCHILLNVCAYTVVQNILDIALRNWSRIISLATNISVQFCTIKYLSLVIVLQFKASYDVYYLIIFVQILNKWNSIRWSKYLFKWMHTLINSTQTIKDLYMNVVIIKFSSTFRTAPLKLD